MIAPIPNSGFPGAPSFLAYDYVKINRKLSCQDLGYYCRA